MGNFDDSIRKIIADIDDDPSSVVYVVRRELERAFREGYERGYAERTADQWHIDRLGQKRAAEDTAIGPPLDEYGHHPEGDYVLWHMAVYIPSIPCGSEGKVVELLNADGIEVYRMWPVESVEQVRAAMDECEESLKAGKDGTDG
jgi:hypothetical protein